MWLILPGFAELVKEWWASFEVEGRLSQIVRLKLKMLKEKLRKWNLKGFGKIGGRNKLILEEIATWNRKDS